MISMMKKVTTFMLLNKNIILGTVTEYVANAPVASFSTNYYTSFDWKLI